MGCNTSQDAAQKADDVKKDEQKENHVSEEHLQDITEEIGSDGKEADKQEEEKAATKIQAVFRGHRARKSIAQECLTDDIEKTSAMSGQAAADASKAELEAEFDPDDKELCHAATKIQASFRGHQVRKQAEQATAKEVDELSAKAEELDIDLTDPELNKAATKIQASFRGHRVRKETDN